MEVEYAPIFDKYKYGTTIWGPLAGGVLTGKYLENPEKTVGRMNQEWYKEFVRSLNNFDMFDAKNIEETRKKFKEFEGIAKSLGGTIG